jgi:hypothetical protein
MGDRRHEYYIKLELQETNYRDRDWTEVAKNNVQCQILATALNMWFQLQESSVAIPHPNGMSYTEQAKTLTDVIKYYKNTERQHDKKNFHYLRKHLKL